jgi:hypothetical protein
MKRNAMNVRTWLSTLCLGLLVACGGGGGDSSPPPASPPPTGATASVAVTVIDTQGRFVSGAAVASGSQAATSDANGAATLAVTTGSEQLVTVAKVGFAEQVKLITVPNARSADALQVMLIERDTAVAINAIESGGSASGRDGVKVTFPAGALVTAAGNAVTGTVQMQMTPVDVTAIDAGAFPGAFEGTPSGGVRSAIMSYGTAELLPLQDGQRLDLAAGKTAQIELPIYAGVHQDGSAVAIGQTIALWSLNASTGVWTQEGTGTVVVSTASPTGKALRATITHFSWWNGDVSAQMGKVNLTVVVPNPNAPIAAGTLASVTGQVVAGSGPAFVASASTVVGVATALSVPSNATTRLAVRVDLPTQVCTGSASVSPAPNANVDVTISAVCFTVPVPTIVQPESGTLTNSSGTLTVTTTIDGSPPDALDVLVDGTLDPNQHIAFAQFFYRTPWNLAPLSEGTHTLTARTTRAGVTRDSTSVTVTIDRTPPQEVTISPAPGSDVTPGTPYTVDFNESVNPGLFALSDAVKLTITPLGQSTPQALQATLAYDDTQRRLTVSLASGQSLPLGVVGLSWGGLQDAADNAVAGTRAATWNVARTANLGALGLFNNTRLSIATNSAGTLFALRQRVSDGNVEASRFDGAVFVPIGPAINDRTPVGDAFGRIAADANGQVFVALAQANAAGTASEVVVKRFDANLNAWVTLVAPFAVPVFNGNIAPTLALDAAGRPVLVFVSINGSLVLRGFRFDGTAWVDLGSLSGGFFAGHAMALDANGLPIVALKDNGTLIVVRNTGGAWVAMGAALDSVPNGTQAIGEPSLAIDGAGQPWVAWSHFPSPPVNLVRFDGAAFVPVAVVPTPTNGHPVITFVNGDPVLAIGDDSSEVRRLHNGVWDTPLPVAVDGRGPIAVAPSNGALVLGVTGNGNGVGTLLKVSFP